MTDRRYAVITSVVDPAAPPSPYGHRAWTDEVVAEFETRTDAETYIVMHPRGRGGKPNRVANTGRD